MLRRREDGIKGAEEELSPLITARVITRPVQYSLAHSRHPVPSL
jgi:hypothetical protein